MGILNSENEEPQVSVHDSAGQKISGCRHGVEREDNSILDN